MQEKDIVLRFVLNNCGPQFSAEFNSTTVMDCTFDGETVDFGAVYDFRPETPLRLKASAVLGDAVCVRMKPYRIELYVNDRLQDEEWPCGEQALAKAQITDCGCGLQMTQEDPLKIHEPSVLGTFQNAEGWHPEENVFVGDCMPYSHNGVYHALYLKDRHHHRSKWGKGAHQWSHISTEDFVNWNIHPMAVEIDRPEEGSICTGSWISDGDTQYLFYTVRSCDDSPAVICRSTSTDGYHFTKDRDFSFVLSSKYTAPSARDPKIVRDADGLYHMILTTSLAQPYRGCLAHLVSEDLTNWRELDEPLFLAPQDMHEPECPDYFYKDGYYYLVYSLRGKGYYLYSKEPFSGWQTPEDPIIPCKSVPKAAVWKDRLIFAGFDGNGVYGGTMTFLEAVVQPDGQLTYQKLD